MKPQYEITLRRSNLKRRLFKCMKRYQIPAPQVHLGVIISIRLIYTHTVSPIFFFFLQYALRF